MAVSKLRGNDEAERQALMERPETNTGWQVRMDASGRILVPAEARALHGWDKDTRLVILEGIDGALRILTSDQLLAQTQDYFIKKFGADRSLVDELIAERAAEAARE